MVDGLQAGHLARLPEHGRAPCQPEPARRSVAGGYLQAQRRGQNGGGHRAFFHDQFAGRAGLEVVARERAGGQLGDRVRLQKLDLCQWRLQLARS